MIIRLYSKEKISACGQVLSLDDKQRHYLLDVLRLNDGDMLYFFDGQNGEFSAKFRQVSHKKAEAVIVEKVRDFTACPDLWLVFAPLKKDNTDFVVEKATELGVSGIVPVITAFTNSGKVRTERFELQSIEAAEQCRRVDLPQIFEPVKLKDLLDKWDKERTLFFLNEKGEGENVLDAMKNGAAKAAVLIGPEGGFSEEECRLILSYDFVCPIFLKGRILRAETAALAALSCWQAVRGDW